MDHKENKETFARCLLAGLQLWEIYINSELYFSYWKNGDDYKIHLFVRVIMHRTQISIQERTCSWVLRVVSTFRINLKFWGEISMFWSSP